MRSRFLPSPATEAVHLLLAFAAIAVLTLVVGVWLQLQDDTIAALLLLLVVLVAATVSTRRVAVSTALTAVLCFNFFFLAPVNSFDIVDPESWVALISLLTVSVVGSQLSTEVRQRAREAMARRDELGRLFEMTRDILGTTDTADAVARLATVIKERFGLRGVQIALPNASGWTRFRAGDPGADSQVERVPLRLGGRSVGELALHGARVEPSTRDAIAGVTAIAIERAHLLEDREHAEVVRRSAELKSALVASLSHALMTPLTAMTVAANNLSIRSLREEQRQEQAEIVRAELDRLNRLFARVRDMAMIETNAVTVEPDWIAPAEIIEAAARHASVAAGEYRLQVDPRIEALLVRVDPKVTSAALAHLLENARQYSPPGSLITVRIAYTAGELEIAVEDRGPGIAEPDLDLIFERFYRSASGEDRRFGAGMGLAIARGLLGAEGGRVWAANNSVGGATFTVAIPAESRTVALVGEA